jgi:hypothetical protein
MPREKIYVPVDPADIVQIRPPPRDVPSFVADLARRRDRKALTLVSAATGGALGGALMGGWTAVAALPICVLLATLGFLQRRGARSLLRVAREGEAIIAKVRIDLGGGPTELKYANEERDVSFGGDLAVFAGDPKSASVSMDYEYAGRIYSVNARVVGEGKPAPVRVAGKVGCAVLVHAAEPGRPLLVTHKMAKAVGAKHA